MLEEGGGGSLRLSGDRSLAGVDLRACGGDLECCLVDLALDLGTCGGGDTQFCLVDLALAGVDLGSCGGWFLSFVWWILSLAGVDLGACGGGAFVWWILLWLGWTWLLQGDLDFCLVDLALAGVDLGSRGGGLTHLGPKSTQIRPPDSRRVTFSEGGVEESIQNPKNISPTVRTANV